MQLEQLLTSLGIPQFIPQLSEFRDELLRYNAAELKKLVDANADEIAQAKNETAVELEMLRAKLAERDALIESAKTAIKGAIADPELDDSATVATIAQVVAVAEMPTIEKQRLALAAEIAKKQKELESLTPPAS